MHHSLLINYRLPVERHDANQSFVIFHFSGTYHMYLLSGGHGRADVYGHYSKFRNSEVRTISDWSLLQLSPTNSQNSAFKK